MPVPKETSIKPKTNDQAIAKVKTLDEIKDYISQFHSTYDSKSILRKVREKIDTFKDGESLTSSDEDLFKALTLFEFDKGLLLTAAIPEIYKVFGLNMLKELQNEYDCNLTSEKATAELAAVSFVRVLELQRILESSLARPEKSQINMVYIGLVGKELDRANRQYLAAIQTLRSMKQPQLGINIRASTAIIGQNQVVQANSNPNDP